MRLYLSSFRLGEHPARLVELVRRRSATASVAVIANAVDGGGDLEQRRQAVAAEISALHALGLTAQELNLLDYRRGGTDLARDLAGYDAVWVRGGNVFTLRHAMHLSGADETLPQLLAEDALVYAGYSAAGCVLAPSLRGLDGCDDPDDVRRLYGAEPIFEGLSILDRAFVPHLDSPEHPESELLAQVAARYRVAGVAYWALRDGQVLVVDGAVADAVVL